MLGKQIGFLWQKEDFQCINEVSEAFSDFITQTCDRAAHKIAKCKQEKYALYAVFFYKKLKNESYSS